MAYVRHKVTYCHVSFFVAIVSYGEDIFFTPFISMNTALRNALRDLQKQRLTGSLPSESVITGSKDGTTWSGKTGDGRDWILTKNSMESFNLQC